MNLPCHFAVLTIGNCIRSVTRLFGGRTCRSMHWRSHGVFGNKVVPRPRRIPQFLTESSPASVFETHTPTLDLRFKPKVEGSSPLSASQACRGGLAKPWYLIRRTNSEKSRSFCGTKKGSAHFAGSKPDIGRQSASRCRLLHTTCFL